MSAVIMITNLLFPPAEPAVGPEAADSAQVATAPTPAPALAMPAAAPAAAGVDTVVVETDLVRLSYSSRGAALLRAELKEYPSYTEEGRPVQLVPAEARNFLSYRVVVGRDTVDLRALPFQPSTPALQVNGATGEQSLRFTYGVPGGFGAEITYLFRPDRYDVRVQGRLLGLGGREATLLTEIGPRLALHEAPEHRTEQQLALVTRVPGDIERLPLRKIEENQALTAPFSWVGIKDKYFFAAVVAGEETPLRGVLVQDLPEIRGPAEEEGEEGVRIPQAQVTALVPVGADGTFAYDAYLGPQDFDRLAALGFDLENVTQYSYQWLEPVIRPLAAAIMWVLGVLNTSLGLAYGWVLVLFGVLMRIVLWPLNAKAMRAQMKNMGVQPLLQEIKEKYRNDPQKQQEAMLALYKEHGFNPFAGCLPMLVPFPVLITLFFVFQNTIAFRGAEFLWLPDLSLRDPLYLLPLVLVVSMFALQWVSVKLSGMEQNPQMKMMMYFMPLMMGVIFFALPAGLNLYYAVTQLASIPQQVMIAKERRRAQDELKKSGGPKLSPPSGGGRKKSKAKG